MLKERGTEERFKEFENNTSQSNWIIVGGIRAVTLL